jgi:tyrosyl-tRNA synthetase
MAKASTNRAEAITTLLSRNVEEVIEREHFASALASGKKLRVKFGIDPTGSHIHIGRAVALWKLREFQDLGHKIVLIIGDFTAQVGDPSDKLEKRPFLTKSQVKTNLKGYLAQLRKIIDLKKTEVRYNSEWLAKLNFREISELAELFTFQQILERRNFKERLSRQQDISYREGMYALMQGYDSVAIRADVELGGTDQLFNLLAGRKIQHAYGQKPQDVMTTRMLLGTDGRKMSTSWGNVINITDEPGEQFGKIMAMSDEVMGEYAELATGMSEKELADFAERAKRDPKTAKMKLASTVVARYHGEAKAKKAAENFEKVFSKKELPDDIKIISPVALASGTLPALLKEEGVVKSNSEGWRLIHEGGVSVDGIKITDPKYPVALLKSGSVIKARRWFGRVK